MRGFFSRVGNSLARFMYGRYGFDELSKFLWIVSLVLLVAAMLPFPFFIPFFLYVLGITLFIYVLIRTFSRKHEKRRRERAWYLRRTARFRNAKALRKSKKRDRKTHVYFKCKHCKNVLRVPRGKGAIVVTCPICKQRIEKNT